jgi:paired amphipathic helix protein Sin3a
MKQDLIVDDALKYLEQVKKHFKNQPEVYNKFLDIMKEFKAQHINTPTVIAQVSTLFEGKPDLILGFNKFLPQNLEISGAQGAVAVAVSSPVPPGPSAGQTSSAVPSAGQAQGAVVTTQPPAAVAATSSATTTGAPAALGSAQMGMPPGPGHAQVAGPPSGGQQNQGRELKVEDALSYLDQVKAKFEGRSKVYTQFLDIMKDFKANVIDTKGVIDRVSELFKDSTDLIVGFKIHADGKHYRS